MTERLCIRCGWVGPAPAGRCPLDGAPAVPDRRGQDVVRRYALVDPIGVGGMDSVVWRARQLSTRRDVAIKLLPATDARAAARFERGAQIASNLNHPHIVTVHDYGRTADGELFVVMELLEGEELSRRMQRTGPLGLDEALRIADQALSALGHAHRRRVVHRDLKPSNLFLVRQDEGPPRVKVLDFGIARFFEGGGDPELAARVEGDITKVRRICGTPRYMAPEQIERRPVDGRADLYALGVVLYQGLAGKPPFAGDMSRLLHQHLRAEPPPLRALRGDVPSRIEAVIHRALAKDPGARWPDAGAMRAALADVAVARAAPPCEPPGRTLTWGWPMLVASLGAALAAVGASALWTPSIMVTPLAVEAVEVGDAPDTPTAPTQPTEVARTQGTTSSGSASASRAIGSRRVKRRKRARREAPVVVAAPIAEPRATPVPVAARPPAPRIELLDIDRAAPRVELLDAADGRQALNRSGSRPAAPRHPR